MTVKRSMTSTETNHLAEEHWHWLEPLLHKVYVDAMVHGVKHGQEWRPQKRRINPDYQKPDTKK